MSSQPSLGRVDSMDQFRGFTVLSMFIVNFAGHMDAIHPFWKHNDNYVTFADWIMPGFIFAVGFSYRLTILKRLEKMGAWSTYSTYIRRSIALILVSLSMYGWAAGFGDWADFSAEETIKVTNAAGELEDAQVNATVHWLMKLIKSNLWEVLSIIGVCQIFIMPVIARSAMVRFVAMMSCLIGHVLISMWFNWGFVHGDQSNWMVQLWGTGSNRSWDGGFFGIMSWSVAMLAGSLIHDILSSNSRGVAGGRTLGFAVIFMFVGYALSCGTRFYDVPLDQPNVSKYAEEPMWPDFSKVEGREWKDLLAESPFVMPPHPNQNYYNDGPENLKTLEAELPDLETALAQANEAPVDENQEDEQKAEEASKAREATIASAEQAVKDKKKAIHKLKTDLLGASAYDYGRQWNYWMMYKRMVSVSFILFATGFAIALYALFIMITDFGNVQVGVFRTFGMNPLAAYVLHSMIGHSLEGFKPDDAPLWYYWTITAAFMGLTYLFVRHLEKHKVFIRL